jgi:NADPH2:quinone reductase
MTTTNQIQIDLFGPAENMHYRQVTLAAPAANEVQIKHHAIGVNYIDTYHRSGLYPLKLPASIGMEGAGEVIAIGSAVTNFAIGDRVGYCVPPVGSYSEVRNFPADKLIALPESISYDDAASLLLQGMTVQYLIRQIYQVKAGDTILLHAAAGGVGLIACQWLKALGATTIGTVGSEAKAKLAKSYGCDHTILYREENIAQRVKELTDGKGVPVVYDSVGKDTFTASLDCLQPRGLMVTFGNASGPVAPFSPLELASRGSLFITRPTLMSYNSTADEMQKNADDLFQFINTGQIKPNIHQRFDLKDAIVCHQALEARTTTGSTLLIP